MHKRNIYKTIILFIIVYLYVSSAGAQVILSGSIYRKSDSVAIEQVVVVAPRSQLGTLSNNSGHYTMLVDTDAMVVFRRLGYETDTIYIRRLLSNIRFGRIEHDHYMKEQVYQLKEYKIAFKKPVKVDPVAKRQEWSYVLDRPRATAQSPLTAMYERFSKKGKELRELEELYYKDEQKRVMSERFTRLQAIQLTGLTGARLDDYLKHCMPSYEFIISVSDYDLIQYMKNCYETYKLANPENKTAPQDSTQTPK